MRPSRHEWAMNMVKVTGQRSTCLRRQVGCVLLNARGHVLATGYNGVASGMPHCNEVDYNADDPSQLIDVCVNSVEVQGLRGLHRPTFPHACPGAKSPSGTNLDGCEAIHAEQNALLQCKDVYEIHACYVSCSPCMTCIKLLLNTSCKFIFFSKEYPHSTAGDLWALSGRFWIQLKENQNEISI